MTIKMGYLKTMRNYFALTLMAVVLSGNASAKPDTGLKCSGKLRIVTDAKLSTPTKPTKEESNEDFHILVKWVGDEFKALFVNDEMWFSNDPYPWTDQCVSHENGLKCELERETKNTVRHRELSLSSSTGLLEFTESSSLTSISSKYMLKREFSGSCAVHKKLF